MCLIKTNSVGDTLWSKLYGGSLIDECYDVIQTTDGGYIMCGKSFSFSASGDYDVYVVKVNNQGNVQWSKTYGGQGGSTYNEIGYSIFQTNDNGYIIAGESMFGFGIGFKNVYLIKTDSLGVSGCNEGSPNTITSNYIPMVTNMTTQVSTGGVMNIPSTIVGNGTTQTIICANVVALINEINSLEATLIYPNPSNGKFKVVCEDASQFQCQVIDQLGKTIISTTVQKDLSDELDLTSFPKGLYFVRLTNETGSCTKKLMID
jgi:hypothetical protein